MQDNKFDIIQLIGYVAIAVIIFSLINIGMSLTGRVADTGVVNVTIETSAAINFTTEFIDFGSGQVDAGQSSATVDTISVSTNGNWTSPADNFVIENIGNVNVSLNLSFGKTANQFLGGTSPSYKYNFTNVSDASCVGGTSSGNTWNTVNTASTGDLLCSVFEFIDTRDDIKIEIQLIIPSDSLTGEQTDTLTATATTI